MRILFCLLILSFGTGCLSAPRAEWCAPCLTLCPATHHEAPSLETLRRAIELERVGDAACVDAYYAAAQRSSVCQAGGASCPQHQFAVAKLLTSSQRFHRLECGRGIRLFDENGETFLPFVLHGFDWSAEHFREFVPVGSYSTKSLQHVYRRDGVGVPFVVLGIERSKRPLLLQCQPFAATAILTNGDASGEPKLHWFSPKAACNPRQNTTDLLEERSSDQESIDLTAASQIAVDQTAPIAYGQLGTETLFLQNYRQPDRPSAAPTLFMAQPYQPGKIPVIFIHGFLSAAVSWSSTINELQQDGWSTDRYQFWFFQYPSGLSFLDNAAELRRQLHCLTARLDPHGQDAALNDVMLIGHSMGGLIAKGQASSSGNRLWESAFNAPLNELRIGPQAARDLRDSFYFTPSPRVSHVVYIATPHRGASIARRVPGRLISIVAQVPSEVLSEHRELVLKNPFQVKSELRFRMPVSIDLLKPNSQILQTLDQIRVDDHVRTDSIIGYGQSHAWNEDSDGVVPISSAIVNESSTTTYVPAEHTDMQDHPITIAQLSSLFRQRLVEPDTQVRPMDLPTADSMDPHWIPISEFQAQ